MEEYIKLFSKYGLRLNDDFQRPDLNEIHRTLTRCTDEEKKEQVLKNTFIYSLPYLASLSIIEPRVFIEKFNLPNEWLDLHPLLLKKMPVRFISKRNYLNFSISLPKFSETFSSEQREEILDSMVPTYKIKKIFAPNKLDVKEEATLSLLTLLDERASELKDSSLFSIQKELLELILFDNDQKRQNLTKLFQTI